MKIGEGFLHAISGYNDVIGIFQTESGIFFWLSMPAKATLSLPEGTPKTYHYTG